ncbi:uncharacterized protein LOC135956030 [Calliphora vicina]|uniref:uncharacterized protein LOC135956030 n=1 Tax=Calliphora vicina TaxID=7373 RepID=UPI00325ACEAD
MSKKSSYSWSHNLLQSNLNNKPTTNAISQTLQIQQTKQNKEINCRRKLYKTTNTTKRYATKTKDKFGAHNCLPNNRARTPLTTRRIVTRTLHFNANSLWRRDDKEQAEQSQLFTECKCSKNCRNHQIHNLQMNCECACKLVNLPNPPHCHQYRQLQQRFATHHHHHLEKSNKLKSFNTSHAMHIPCKNSPECLAYVHAAPLKMNKNHCHQAQVGGGGGRISNMLQLHDVKPCVSNTTQLSKYHHNHRHHHHHDSQLTWLPQVSQHQEHFLLSMFEVLPPLFLSKSTPSNESMKYTGKLPKKNQHQNHHCLLQSKEYQQKPQNLCCSAVMGINPKMFHPLPQSCLKHFNLDYDRILKYLETKSKPSDRDVIFGNACLLLSKRYGWETSRIEWLLQLEQKQYSNSHFQE